MPTIDEFKRLKSYACRIRRISYLPYVRHKDTTYPQDQKALRTLLSYHDFADHPLFPNLRQLEFVDANHAVNCLDICLLSKPISLSFFWDDSNGGLNPVFQDIFQNIEERALNMEELELGSFQSGSPVYAAQDTQDLSTLVCKMSELRRFATGLRLLDQDALRHLASLPRLRKLHIPNASMDILESVRTLHCAIFPEFQQLSLHETHIPSFTRLIVRLKPLRLQALMLLIRYIPTARQIHSIFSALEKSTQHAELHRVVLKVIRYPLARHTRFSLVRESMVNGSVLEPLLSFPNLTAVELNLPCIFDIGDAQVRAMAEAWPRLRCLQLGSLVGWCFPSSVTCTGILSLVRNCRELEYLALPFNGSGDSVPLRSSLTSADVNEKITYLYVGNGEVKSADIKRVSQFLGYIFPRLCGIGGAWLCRSGQDEWKNVLDCLEHVHNAA